MASLNDIPDLQLVREPMRQAPRSNVRRTSFESGPPRQSRISDRVLMRYTVGYIMPRASFQQFIGAWWDSINHGADLFGWTNPIDSTEVQVRMVDGVYNAAPISNNTTHYLVEFDIEEFKT